MGRKGEAMTEGYGATWRVETWLLDQGKLHRARSNDELTYEEFEEQRDPQVAYVVYRRQRGSYSNSSGGRPRWRRIKRLSWVSRYV
jgi:hypothetical protein